MRNSKDQLMRVLTIGLVLGALLFIVAAEISYLQSGPTVDGTIYIQEDGVTTVVEEEDSREPLDIESVVTDSEIIESQKEPADNAWVSTVSDNLNFEKPIDIDHINLLITNMGPDERARVLGSSDLFTKVVESEADNRAVLMAAAKNKLNKHPNVEFMMERSSENMLLEFYLNLLTDRKLPEGFPSDEQARNFYESNKEKQFTFPLRARIWQIYLSKPNEASEEEILNLQQKAEEIVLKIKTGANDFSNLAVSQSQHEASKNRGGYMGVMKLDGLLPEIKDYILRSKIGEVSDPIETDTGLHIIKRGTILSEEALPFEEVEEQVRQILIKQTQLQLKNAIVEQARADNPQNISEEVIAEWWLNINVEDNP